MKLYPWLIKPYNNIVQQYQKKKAHHAILIKTPRGIGVSLLIWFISKWLLCLKPIGLNSCDKCHGCKLMSANNHPDWHNFTPEKNNLFSIESVRIINEKIFTCSRQGGSKIIFLSDTGKLTESAINAFLKTLEEPPRKTWFFLVNYKNLNSHSTLNSRCLIYKLFIPEEKKSLYWLKKETVKKNRSCLTALRINQGSPLYAKKFINSNLWIDRINFYECLHDSFKKNNLLKILPLITEKDSQVKIDWICFLLFDSIKFYFNENDNLTNSDQIELIQFFSYNYKNTILDTSIRTWLHCKYRLSNISGINCELLLSEQLLIWEKILNFS
ncbi:DNA polymerase III subunit delta' C-terminal domain-containing protein [Buchnera aphidicola str. APS (Acyrthosiphon pisum)]|uniref:DNA polymerase III subunit delta' n=1 Tax=Buchnera aphidicola subsp. Acyrthosiphon pisum (strain APS) TaxID=107806 RepID=HOLB_BUCAI|nr:DNA polymerase III subunit delta' C-terminal domain-containing protein [Buchnera aphidicola]P57435.1 RecName: Full=DNA polymerase III subunit delta' [Buchnera aphidicola str. APS (Acyrthosiphon pisum)]pir/B84971/ DNA-directed DNA polymerase (EC 2.7.7.7) [imported] - Buchnera sp. (strain APS) [Buchnera sp. (in: enterobacteria)]BAB13058.1 DNA polymerase III delta' subunit [Buchnera aphidicola str. APS (Acyrthosiphon pisum)]